MAANPIQGPCSFNSKIAAIAMFLFGATPLFAYDPVLRTIDSTGDVGAGSSVAVVNGYLAVSYADDTNQRLKLWYDNGAGGGTAGDMIANGSEIRVVDPSRTVTSSGSSVGRITNFGGRIAIAYCDVTTWDLILWIDDGAGGGTAGDAIPNGNEIRVIDTTGTLAINIAMTTLNGKLAIAYSDSTNYLVKLWYDDGSGGGTAGDGNANGTEIRTIASMDGQELALTVANGKLALAFQDFGPQNLMLWYDDGDGGGTAGDAEVNGSELRTTCTDAPTAFFNSITSYGGHVGVSYYHFNDSSLRFWFDDGAGGGIADNGVADGSEIRIIEAPSGVGGSGFYTSITTIQNRLAISAWGTPPDALRFWYDDGDGGGTAGDVASNGTELRIFNSTDTAYFSSLTAVGSHLLVAAYYDGTDADLKLGILEVATPPDAPSSLGPTTFVNGSSSVDTTPTFSFSQSDANTSDTLAYRIQIDDTSDFSSPVVDYTSDSIAHGAAGFTVGQAAGAGSYTVGAASQTLAIGSYYWRVRSADATANGAWTLANSGAVAFVVTAIPTVITTSSSSIATTSASSGGNVTAAGSASVTARGVCWSVSHNPTTSDSKTTDGTGTGSFSSSITGLAPSTVYYVRAYATNSAGTAYGSEVSLETSQAGQSNVDTSTDPTASGTQDSNEIVEVAESQNSATPATTGLCGMGVPLGVLGSLTMSPYVFRLMRRRRR